ncbi:MAG: isoprenylcysteine carboxylmethyltransferase family protein, partial [Planctomycetota bacterium]
SAGYRGMDSGATLIPDGCPNAGTGNMADRAARRLHSAKAGRELVTGGIYRRLRHPIYLGDILWPIGWAILFKARWALAVTPVWVVLLLIIAILEEKMLAEAYPEEYKEYKKRVPFVTLRVL